MRLITTRPISLIIMAIVLAIMVPSTVFAQPSGTTAGGQTIAEQVEALSAEGATMFGKGNYSGAIARFKRAYNLEPVANLLYNIALSYERLDDLDNAILHYEKFIVSDDADPDTRVRALTRSKELEQKREKLAREKLVTPLPETPVEKKPKTEPVDDGMSTMTVTGIIVTGIGVAMVGTGGAFALFAQNDMDKFTDAQNALDKSDFQDSSEQNALTADVLYGAGSLATITGVALIILGSMDNNAEEQESTWHLSPTAQPGQVGAVVTIPLGDRTW